MIDFYKPHWDKVSHFGIAFLFSLTIVGAPFIIGWFHSREYSTATRYMNSRSLKLLPPWTWEWEPIEGKPTAEDSRWDFYAALAGAACGTAVSVAIAVGIYFYFFGGV